MTTTTAPLATIDEIVANMLVIFTADVTDDRRMLSHKLSEEGFDANEIKRALNEFLVAGKRYLSSPAAGEIVRKLIGD